MSKSNKSKQQTNTKTQQFYTVVKQLGKAIMSWFDWFFKSPYSITLINLIFLFSLSALFLQTIKEIVR